MCCSPGCAAAAVSSSLDPSTVRKLYARSEHDRCSTCIDGALMAVVALSPAIAHDAGATHGCIWANTRKRKRC